MCYLQREKEKTTVLNQEWNSPINYKGSIIQDVDASKDIVLSLRNIHAMFLVPRFFSSSNH